MTRIAVIGATGAVGRQMIEDLESSGLENIDPVFLASPRSAGSAVSFRGTDHTVQEYSLPKVEGCKYALMSAGGGFSREHAKAIVAGGTTVIDNSSAWRMDPEVALVVPEINIDAVRAGKAQIIANPNCSTIQMVCAIKPLKDAFGLKSIQVATYQSVSGTGQKGIQELATQLERRLKFEELEPQTYAQPIAFNVLPAIDVLDDEGHCFEEVKMIQETRKIFNMSQLPVMATTVRVPVFNCHCETVTLELAEEIDRKQALAALAEGEGLVVHEVDKHEIFPTPLGVTGDGRVHVARVRLPHGKSRSSLLQFWVVADNLKKGAATNAVQILEKLESDK